MITMEESAFNEQVRVKQEEDEVKDEPECDLLGISAAAARAGLYADHVVKDELVLGPEGPQPPDIVFTLRVEKSEQPVAAPPAAAARGEDSDSHEGQSVKSEDDASSDEDCIAPAAGGRGEGRAPTRARGRRHCCPICRKGFVTPSALKIHERTHTGEKPISCGICSRKFTQLSTLKTHERTHTGERPYSCVTCSRKFTHLGSLKRHERTHTGERPFSCRICLHKFTQLSHLKSHERTHTAEQSYSCDACGKQFTQLRYLLAHKDRIHINRKRFCCDICQKRFAQKITLVGHIRWHMSSKPR